MNIFPQCAHEYLLSPRCALSWRSLALLRPNVLPHWEQRNFFSGLWLWFWKEKIRVWWRHSNFRHSEKQNSKGYQIWPKFAEPYRRGGGRRGSRPGRNIWVCANSYYSNSPKTGRPVFELPVFGRPVPYFYIRFSDVIQWVSEYRTSGLANRTDLCPVFESSGYRTSGW